MSNIEKLPDRKKLTPTTSRYESDLFNCKVENRDKSRIVPQFSKVRWVVRIAQGGENVRIIEVSEVLLAAGVYFKNVVLVLVKFRIVYLSRDDSTIRLGGGWIF
tara:strand:- start:67 stop:378 length:312 start_codon:yes stop_codon:yes gene_type:complete